MGCTVCCMKAVPTRGDFQSAGSIPGGTACQREFVRPNCRPDSKTFRIVFESSDSELEGIATENAQVIAAGHIFVIALREGYPINLLSRIKDVPEVCNIYCATANPVEVIVAESEQGRGILGVIDGSSPKGIENEADKQWRHDLLRKISYKR